MTQRPVVPARPRSFRDDVLRACSAPCNGTSGRPRRSDPDKGGCCVPCRCALISRPGCDPYSRAWAERAPMHRNHLVTLFVESRDPWRRPICEAHLGTQRRRLLESFHGGAPPYSVRQVDRSGNSVRVQADEQLATDTVAGCELLRPVRPHIAPADATSSGLHLLEVVDQLHLSLHDHERDGGRSSSTHSAAWPDRRRLAPLTVA